MNTFLSKKSTPPTSKVGRLFKAIWRQQSKTPICLDQPRLDSKLILMTGGNNGIGYETCKGLVKRGGELIVLSRNKEKSMQAINRIQSEYSGKIHYFHLDLGDIQSIKSALLEVRDFLSDRQIDMFISNSGITTDNHSLSKDAYELTFAVNVLGPHVLLKELLKHNFLKREAKIVVVAGDIYFMADDCTHDYSFKTGKGMNAYSRSKLGLMWWAMEANKRYPDKFLNIVHPGVVATGLGGERKGFSRLLSKIMMLSPLEGAQTTLVCATQQNLIKGGYYHNTMGLINFSSKDPALNSKKSKDFWNLLEELC